MRINLNVSRITTEALKKLQTVDNNYFRQLFTGG